MRATFKLFSLLCVLGCFFAALASNASPGRQEKPNVRRTDAPQQPQEEKKIEPGTIERIIKQLKDERLMVRLNAAINLGRYPSQAEAAIPDLIDLLNDRSDDRVRDAAVATLGKMSDVAIPQLFKAYERGDSLLRANLLKVMGKLRHARLEKKHHETAKKLEDFLLHGLQEPGDSVPLHAMNALAAISPRSKGGICALIDFAKDANKSDRLRGVAVLLLGRYGQDAQEAVKPLMAFLTGEKTPYNVRSAAANSLAKIAPNNEAFLLVIRKILVNPKEHVRLRWAAARAIGETGTTDKVAVAELVNVLRGLPIGVNRDGDNSFDWSVSGAIAKLKPAKEALPVLLEHAHSDDEVVQIHMFIAIGNMGSEAKSAVPTLIKLARKPANRYVLKDIVAALGNIGPDAKLAIPLLNEIAEKTENPKLKEQVTRAQARIQAR